MHAKARAGPACLAARSSWTRRLRLRWLLLALHQPQPEPMFGVKVRILIPPKSAAAVSLNHRLSNRSALPTDISVFLFRHHGAAAATASKKSSEATHVVAEVCARQLNEFANFPFSLLLLTLRSLRPSKYRLISTVTVERYLQNRKGASIR